MGKAILILLIIAALVYFIAQKISKFKYNTYADQSFQKDRIEISLPTFILQSLLKKTITTVGIGFLLLVIILVLASKFKILLILLPISLYLIGQFFIFNNHVKIIKSQKIFFNSKNNIVTVVDLAEKVTVLDLSDNTTTINEVKSVQSNGGILMGYYQISSHDKSCYIPFIVAKNPQTKAFFDKIEKTPHKSETKLFPII